MKQRISILGCGWLGMPLAFELIQNGYHVNGSTTSNNKLNKLRSKGVMPFMVDISKRDVDVSNFLFSDVLIIAIPSKKINDFKHLIAQIEKSETRKVIFISSTSVYPNTNGIVTENTITKKSSLSEIEQLFKLNTIFKSTIIRFGGLFGHDRKPGNFIKVDKKIENPEGFINFVHRDDCVRIIDQVIACDTWNETLNACADTHPKRREFYKKEMKKIGRLEPIFNENSTNDYKIVSNEKLKTLLGYKFEYSNLMNY
ncbi:MAG: hypothetical protein COB01_07930 [Lutibacter sp.]|nr:MAG: hypothetical protein COB01_07930 [Lutibacter sp.]